jgi:four helix bundle protein
MENWVLEENGNFLKLNDINAYKISFHLSNFVWERVILWKNFEKDTVGKQFVRAVDSVSANIAEGFGRFNKREKIHFYRISFGSLKETYDWNEKARVRNILTIEDYQYIIDELNKLPKEINHLIKFTNEKLIY